MRISLVKIDGVAYRSVWVDADDRLVSAYSGPDEIALVAGDPAPDRRATRRHTPSAPCRPAARR